MMAQLKPFAHSKSRIGKYALTSLLITTVFSGLLLLSITAIQLRNHTQIPRAHEFDKTLDLPLEESRLNGPPLGRRSEDGTFMILDSERTLWTAGWNARHTRYYNGSIPAIRWTANAEEVFEREYRRLHFPSSCATVKGWLVTKPYWWGLVSVARDYQSDILRAMAQNLTLVHDGAYMFCPDHPDRYLNCFWEDFGSCQDSWKAQPDVPVREQVWQESVEPITDEEFPHWLWESMADHVCICDGLSGETLTLNEEADLDSDMFLQLKLSVVRAIMTKVIFKPRLYITERSAHIVETWRNNGSYSNGIGHGLIVHVRRTDKKEDLGNHWQHIDFNSTRHMGAYIQAMEAATQTAFSRFLVLSDDPHMHDVAVSELTPYFRNTNETQSLYSNSLCHFLGSNSVKYTGHESLDHKARHDLYVLLLSDVYAAVQVSDYIIGSGSCGVSQFLAWNLGAKHRFEPSLTAFWEEDIIVKECRWLSNLIQNEDLPPCSPIRQAMLDKEWTERNCPMFLPSPKSQLSK